jgi:hypothetical protein
MSDMFDNGDFEFNAQEQGYGNNPNDSTTLWACCICGDGPKVCEIEIRCIYCQHDVCELCIIKSGCEYFPQEVTSLGEGLSTHPNLN